MAQIFILTFLLVNILLPIQNVNANSEIGGLTKCSESTAFQKRLKTSTKKLEQRINKYKENSSSSLLLKQQLAQLKARFDKYSRSNLLCGNDGLPHLIADGRWSHAAEFILPGFGFIYITGWIGWVGRKYLQTIREYKDSFELQIIIDVPLALKIMSTGYLWPILAFRELIQNKLVIPDSMISVSPR
uniref:Photosystem I reaction center subunit III n=1 Tax=Astrosyne radiata TaxID=1158023 RepID=A0A2U9NTD2_9STRA|nr:photosystem I subunit III [Astrosyne radiata]YP_009497683.1 photosystem I subunit III [Astrosyne radiata]AWT40329.1 photosystem I subunit III [Astrosyne radiata]AWT40396.1 photosystem I subunit III [Astrosyne radiata]